MSFSDRQPDLKALAAQVAELVGETEDYFAAIQRFVVLCFRVIALEQLFWLHLVPIRDAINAYFKDANPNELVATSDLDELHQIIGEAFYTFYNKARGFFEDDFVLEGTKFNEVVAANYADFGLNVVIPIFPNLPSIGSIITMAHLDAYRLNLMKKLRYAIDDYLETPGSNPKHKTPIEFMNVLKETLADSELSLVLGPILVTQTQLDKLEDNK